ncbi:MAG: hypothetical protein MUC76_03835 [Spirochaetes bacterium]|jgi:hypothetical protein|nr:hypothetical protein [Spirochaetota bacterium]
MNHIIPALLIALLISLGCGGVPDSIPTGRWNYALLINGARGGNAVISNRREGETYIITSELTMNIAGMQNVSRQVVTETTEFTPVKIETSNRIKFPTGWKDIETTALFRGRNVEIRSGGRKTTVTLQGDFVLDGNYFAAKLIEGRFREGLEIKGAIYDPSIELDALVPVTTRVVGRELVDVAGTKRRLLHVSQSIDVIKSADSYLDEKGVMVKAVIQMMNLTVELILE